MAVRGGGHERRRAPRSSSMGGLVVDLSAHEKRAGSTRYSRLHRAEGGATWAEFDHDDRPLAWPARAASPHPQESVDSTLGGGLGYLNPQVRSACDNLISADVVTADGRILTANATDEQRICFGRYEAQGSATSGVVTSFEYQLHPVTQVLAGVVVSPLARAKEVLRFYRAFSLSAPDELRLDVVDLGTSPNGPSVAIIACWCGPIEEGELALKALRSFGPPVRDTIAAVPYKTIQTLLESHGVSGARPTPPSGKVVSSRN